MKQFKFFAVALAALTMFSCSKENITDNPGNNAPGSKASVTVNFANPGDSRAAGRPLNNEDAKIDNYSIFLFRAGGELDGKVYGSGTNISTATAVTVTGTTAATSVYVVANAGNMTGTISTKKALEDKLVQLTTKADGTGDASQISTKVWMSGQGTVTFDPDATTATVPVTLKFVGAKLSVTVDYTGVITTGPDAKDGGAYGTDYKINRVFVMNAGGVSKLFGTSLIPTKDELTLAKVTPYFVSGLTTDNRIPAWTNMAKIYGESTSMVTDFTDATAVAAGAHFYVFEQNGATTHQTEAIATIVVVEATWISSLPDANKIVYFPIKFNLADATKTITRGNAYDIKIFLKGNFKNPGDGGNGGGGTEDPGTDLIASTVTVTVTPATWAGVPVEKDFN